VSVPPSSTGKWRVEGGELVEDNLKGSMYIFFGDPKWTDYDFSVAVMRMAGDNQVGLLFRSPRPFDGCIFTFGTAKGGPPMAGRLKSGGPIDQRGPLLVDNFKPIESDRWYTAKVSVRDDQAQCFLDGVKLFDFKIDPPHAGSVGLRTWFTSCRLKNIKVTAPDGTVLLEGLPDFDLKPPPLPPLELPKEGKFVPLFDDKGLVDWKMFGNDKGDCCASRRASAS
jgi:hypothetical protein